MLVKLTYGTNNAVGRNWKETETLPARAAAQQAALLSAILFKDKRSEHNFTVGEGRQELTIYVGCYFIRVEVLEKEKKLGETI